MSEITGNHTANPVRVLIADDDQVLAELLKEFLETEGWSVVLANNGEQALQQLEHNLTDIVVLDIMMPILSGIDTLKRLRINSNIPVIMLTARGDDLDRILGLELGADDYIPKPCNPRELIARIRAVLRRTQNPDTNQTNRIITKDLTVDSSNRSVYLKKGNLQSNAVVLTQTEFDILFLLIRNKGVIVSKQEISLTILGKPLRQWDRSIDVHISNLRRKLGPHGDGQDRIRTIRGSGYLYDEAEDTT